MRTNFIDEFLLVLECKVIAVHEIGAHTQFVGEIVDLKTDVDVLDSNGLPDIAKLKPMIYDSAASAYNSIGDFLGKAFTACKNL